MNKLRIIEDVKRGTYSRIGDEVRRNAGNVTFLKTITVSQNAPEWRKDAKDIQRKDLKGIQSILAFDSKGYKEVWYKTATGGHRAALFAR